MMMHAKQKPVHGCCIVPTIAVLAAVQDPTKLCLTAPGCHLAMLADSVLPGGMTNIRGYLSIR